MVSMSGGPQDINERVVFELRKLLNEAEREIERLLAEAEQSEDQLRYNQDLIFSMLHRFGPNVKFEIENFHEHMCDAQILGGVGIDESGTLSVNIDFYLHGAPENKQANETT